MTKLDYIKTLIKNKKLKNKIIPIVNPKKSTPY